MAGRVRRVLCTRVLLLIVSFFIGVIHAKLHVLRHLIDEKARPLPQKETREPPIAEYESVWRSGNECEICASPRGNDHRGFDHPTTVGHIKHEARRERVLPAFRTQRLRARFHQPCLIPLSGEALLHRTTLPPRKNPCRANALGKAPFTHQTLRCQTSRRQSSESQVA